jgi:hypothetical protein
MYIYILWVYVPWSEDSRRASRPLSHTVRTPSRRTHTFLLGWGGGVEGGGWGTRCPGVVDILSPCHTWDGLELIPTSTPTNFAFVLALICVCTVLGSVVVGE